MRRTKVILPAALMLLAFVPASALAGHHHRRHHARVRHARIERFGRDFSSPATTSNSADNAGTVQSFSNGVLKITLRNGSGSTVSGAVTRDTEIECMAPEQNQAMHEDGDRGGDESSGDGGSGDQSGSSEDQAEGSGDQSSGDQSSGDDQGDATEQDENQAEDQNENETADENENEMESNCSTADLTRGTVVREAELRISSAGHVWKKVELGS